MRKLALTFTIAGALALVACQDRARQQTEPGQGGSGMQDQTTLPGDDRGSYQQDPGTGGTGGTGMSDDIEQQEMQRESEEGMGGQQQNPQEGMDR